MLVNTRAQSPKGESLVGEISKIKPPINPNIRAELTSSKEINASSTVR